MGIKGCLEKNGVTVPTYKTAKYINEQEKVDATLVLRKGHPLRRGRGSWRPCTSHLVMSSLILWQGATCFLVGIRKSSLIGRE